MTRLINTCPSCGSGAIHRRCRKKENNEKYRCSVCKTNFEKPVKKETGVDLNRRRIPKALEKYLN